jgi:hypothetical protein
MPMLQLSDVTIRLARRAGLPPVRIGNMAPNWTWTVPVGDDIAALGALDLYNIGKRLVVKA